MNPIWQDTVLMLTGFGFSSALISTIRARSKPTRLTCLTTAVLLAINSVCMATLGLWLAFISLVLTTVAWVVLLVQRRPK